MNDRQPAAPEKGTTASVAPILAPLFPGVAPILAPILLLVAPVFLALLLELPRVVLRGYVSALALTPL